MLGQLTRAAAPVVVALMLVLALDELPDSVRAAEAQVAQNEGLSPLERELAPTRAYGLPAALVLRADELLPEDAVYAVVTGAGMLSGHDAAAPFSAYWLLPRRRTTDLRRAEWILSYGADPGTLGVDVTVVEDLGQGLRLLRRAG